MSNFSDFINKNIGNDNTGSAAYSKEDLQSKIDKYSNYSEDKLLNEFVKLTMEKKKRGELLDVELENLKNTISPMLNIEQKKSLERLIQLVKEC
jgi:hypothetical protein